MRRKREARGLDLFASAGDQSHPANGAAKSSRKLTGQLWFTSLRLGNWRNFSTVDLELRQRVFLVGPNASGKTNLLDVFRFLRDIVDIGGGLQSAIERRGGISGIRCLAARQSSDVEIEVRIGNDADPNAWGYHLVIHQDSQRNPMIRRERVLRGDRILLDRPEANDTSDPRRLTQTFLEQVNVNREYRYIADFFASVAYLHVVPQLVREPNRSRGMKRDPFGGDLLEQIASTNQRTQQARLRRIASALRVAVPQIDKLEIERDVSGVPHLRGRYKHWRPKGAWQREDQFSDGTLRLLGLLWSLDDGTGPLLLEEPELSLHPEVIRHLPQLFHKMQRRKGRQILVSTHSPDLLSDEGIGLDEVMLLVPSPNGTVASPARSKPEIETLVRSGIPLPEAVLPHTRPAEAAQLSLFADGPGAAGDR